MGERNQGNPNQSRFDQEASRVGVRRAEEDIPKQAAKSRFSDEPGNVTFYNPAATYQLGIPQRPSIQHDNGFLTLGSRAATAADHVKLAYWRAKLEGAEALRPDLVDALAAYRHFLTGKGATREFSYERYVANDQSGQTTLKNAILDIQAGAISLFNANKKLPLFMLTGSAIGCGSSALFPYPATENWQKAIGGHSIWLSGNVEVENATSAKPKFTLSMTLHAEDRYNFNPGQNDIVTGVPDSDNGIFEMTGLAHQYDNTSTLKRVLVWIGSDLGLLSANKTQVSRERQPTDNRRLRNRI